MDGRVLADHYPGIGRALYAVLPELGAGEDTIVLFRCAEPDSDRFPLAGLRDHGVEIEYIGADLRTVKEQLALPIAVRRFDVDVVLTAYFATALIWPCPRVTMVHDLIPLHVPASMPSRVSRVLYRLAFRGALLSSKLITSPSSATAEQLAQHAPRMRSRIRVVPHALDPRFVPASRDEIGAVRSSYRLGEDYLLVVAGDRPHKNLTFLVDSWVEAYTDQSLDAVLAIAGMPTHACDHPAIRVLGAVPETELPALYSGALAVVVPSLEEGFGLPAAEAMACHTALACSDRPALRELAGEAAIYFDPLDRAAFGRALIRVIEDSVLRNTLVEHGRSRTNHLAPRLVASQLRKVLKEALRGDQ